MDGANKNLKLFKIRWYNRIMTQADILRKMTPSDRINQVFQSGNFARKLAKDHLIRQNPNISEFELQKKFIGLLHGTFWAKRYSELRRKSV